MDFFSNLLQRNPELAVFLAIGIGYWVGAFKIRGVGFGPVTGSLLAGLLIGYFVQVPIRILQSRCCSYYSCSASDTPWAQASSGE